MAILRLDKILSHMGWGTRNEIKKVMKKGAVTINGVVTKDPGLKVNPEEVTIKVFEEIVHFREYIYFMLNKPAGCISATFDKNEETVIDLLDPEDRVFSVFPVGRLDKDTEGLLLLTNDGKLAHKLISPKRHIPKKYSALVKGEVTAADQDNFQRGITLDDGYITMPAELKIIKPGSCSEVEVIIFEGKYHQVKRMFEALEKKVLQLKRLSMGSLTLDEELLPGQYRELTEEELAGLQEE